MKNIILLFILIIPLVLMFVPVSFDTPIGSFDSIEVARGATNYYVATTGSDAAAGTEANPWQTIQKAATTMTAGDTVFIRSGTYNEQIFPANDGTAGNPITYTSYAGETAKIDGAGFTISSDEGIFDLSDDDYIVFDGLTIANAQGVAGAGGSAIYGINSDNVTVNDCYIYNCGGSGIFFDFSSDNIITNNELNYNTTQYSNEQISVRGCWDFDISYNNIYNIPNTFDIGCGKLLPKEGIDAKVGSHDGVIHHNTIRDARTGIYIDGYTQDAYNISIYNNEISNFATSGITVDTENAPKDVYNIYIYNNVIRDSYFITSSWCYGKYGIILGETANSFDNIYIINNTTYNIDKSHLLIDGVGSRYTNLYVRNNIFWGEDTAYGSVKYDNGAAEYNASDHIFTNNNYGTEGTDGGAGWYGTSFITTDPAFVNPGSGNAATNYDLLYTSPCIGNAISTDAPSIDFNDSVRPQEGSYDIGAFEYVPPGNQHEALSDNNDATFVLHPGGSNLIRTGTYTIDTTNLGGDPISSVKVYLRAWKGTPSWDAYITPTVTVSGSSSEGGEDTLTTTATTRSDAMTHPSGGTWTFADLASAEWGIRLRHGTPSWTNGARASEMYVEVTYTSSSGSLSEVTRSIVAGITIPVVCAYDGVNMTINTGGTSTQAAAITIYSNTSPVNVAEFDGLIDDTIIKSAGTEVLHFDYEPEDCSDTAIADKSAFGNDAVYTLASAPSCLSVSYSSIDFTGETQRLSASSYPQEGLGIISPLDEMPPSVPDENSDNVLRVFSDALSDTSASLDDSHRIPTQMIATAIYLGAMIWVWLKMSKYVRDRMLLGLATMVVTAAFVALGDGLIHWGLLIFHIIIVISLGVSERNRTV